MTHTITNHKLTQGLVESNMTETKEAEKDDRQGAYRRWAMQVFNQIR